MGTANAAFPTRRSPQAVRQVFSFKPADIVTQLDLLRPIYRSTTNYGHFGKPDLPWEQTNKTDALRAAAEISAPDAKPNLCTDHGHRHHRRQTPDYHVKDISLAEWGRKEISIAEHEMPGLMAVRKKFGAGRSRSPACASRDRCT